MNLVRKQADTPSETKAKEEAEAAKAAEEKAAADMAAEEAAAQEKAAAEKAAAEEKAKEEARLEAEKKAAEEAKAEEAKAKEKAEADAKAKAEAEAAAAEAAKAPEPKVEEKPAAAETEDEEMERMIREMEEEDARREKEQEEISARKRAEKEEEKKRADAAKLNSADNDKKLREQEAEMERLEEERERRRKEADAKGEKATSVSDLLSKPMSALKLAENEKATTDASTKLGAADKAKSKPAALNLAPLKTTPVEAPQPSAALQSLRSARFLQSVDHSIYPAGIASPNPALNAAVQKKGKIFKYDAQFLLQFQQVFTEQPSEEFHRQIKVLIGDSDGSRSASARTPGAGSGRQNSRAGASSAFPSGGAMGQFGAAKTLPPGTTSEQRFAMSQGNTTRPAMGSMGGFNRGGAFPGGQMSRTPSSNAIGLPSPRTGSRRGGGGGSKRDFGGAKGEAQAAKTMPLTHGQDLKPITVSATGWKPSSVGNKAAQAPTAVAPGGHLDPGMVQRKVKAALNKMTPENFQKISDQILTIAAQSKNEPDGRTLRQVIQLTFEKATDEAHWASMYAKFCKCMLENMSADIRDESILDKAGNVVSGGALFRKYLLNRCQEEFERGWKIDLPQPKEGEDKKATEAALLSDEYYIAAAAKRRGLGLVQFIGELYKLGMLTERIMHECVRKLLEFTGVPDEAEIESLTKLLKTIGGNLDSTEKGRSFMSAYFARIDNIVHLEGLPSRLMFMLMDIIDLRKSGWVSKEANKGPKTLEEVRAEVRPLQNNSQSTLKLTCHQQAEAAAAQKAAESARSHQRGPPGGGGGGRPMGGRGESRNFSYNNSVPNQVGMDDLRRLKGSSSRTSSQNPSFGPTSMFNSRSNSGRTRLGGPGGAFGRAGEDSGASSRTGTPPVRDRDSVAHTNAFGYVLSSLYPSPKTELLTTYNNRLLADTGDHPGSPPSAHASPALPKATLDTVAAGNGKKE
jgi:translation initiation factor 4G